MASRRAPAPLPLLGIGSLEDGRLPRTAPAATELSVDAGVTLRPDGSIDLTNQRLPPPPAYETILFSHDRAPRGRDEKAAEGSPAELGEPPTYVPPRSSSLNRIPPTPRSATLNTTHEPSQRVVRRSPSHDVLASSSDTPARPRPSLSPGPRQRRPLPKPPQPTKTIEKEESERSESEDGHERAFPPRRNGTHFSTMSSSSSSTAVSRFSTASGSTAVSRSSTRVSTASDADISRSNTSVSASSAPISRSAAFAASAGVSRSNTSASAPAPAFVAPLESIVQSPISPPDASPIPDPLASAPASTPAQGPERSNTARSQTSASAASALPPRTPTALVTLRLEPSDLPGSSDPRLRPPRVDASYAAFTPMVLKAHSAQLDAGFPLHVPRCAPGALQHPFAAHDVPEEEWIRFLDDLRDVAAQNGDHVQLMASWNERYFYPRKMETLLARDIPESELSSSASSSFIPKRSKSVARTLEWIGRKPSEAKKAKARTRSATRGAKSVDGGSSSSSRYATEAGGDQAENEAQAERRSRDRARASEERSRQANLSAGRGKEAQAPWRVVVMYRPTPEEVQARLPLGAGTGGGQQKPQGTGRLPAIYAHA